MSANKIKKLILLIHGEDESKVTTTMQVATIAYGIFEYRTFQIFFSGFGRYSRPIIFVYVCSQVSFMMP